MTARNSDDRERVRDASDIVRVIGEVATLKPSGREFRCLCPFHDDHRPSMYVVPSKQIFKCFVCGVGGDVFTFVEKFHNMEFREALEYLAERGGVELTPVRAQPSGHLEPAAEPGVTRADLVRANAFAAEFFRTILRKQDLGEVGREIIGRRGIAPEMAESYALGLSPDRWDGLALTVQSKNLSPEPFIEAGLFKRRERESGHYDAFRNRLMFPIHDQTGRVIAFGARKIREEDEPKYLNSAESRVFDKSGTLYGLHQAARSIQRERTAVITEGYTDTIACHQAGFTNAVATLGTALTIKHAAVLRRLCDTVILLFDGDEAGQRAADRAVEVFFREDIDLKIATLSAWTDAKDPDELLKRDGGADVLRTALAGAVDLLAYRYARIRERLRGAGISALNRAVDEDLRQLVDLGFNSVPLRRRMLIIKQIAEITGLSERVISESVPAGRREPGFAPANAPRPIMPALGTQARALGCLLCDPGLWVGLSDTDREALDPAHLEEGHQRAVAEAMFDLAAQGSCDLAAVMSVLQATEQHVATDMCMHAARLCETEAGHSDPARIRGYFRDCLRALTTDESPRSLEFARERAAANGPNRRVIPRPKQTG